MTKKMITIRIDRQAMSLLLAFLLVLVSGAAWAQSPFGAPHPSGGGLLPQSSIVGWIFAQQSAFYRSLSGLIRQSRDDGNAMWSLFGVSFLYGIFHAAGPGHGKAVISSYLVANEETWRRGVALSFLSSAIQSVVAIVVVAIAAILLGATAKAIGTTVHVVEIVSYGLIVLIGVRLLLVKGRSFVRAWQKLDYRPHLEPAVATAAAPIAIGAARLGFGRGSAARFPCADCGAGHAHAFHCEAGVHEDHESAWAHGHGPEPADLAGAGGWRRGLSAVIATGLRPCSGAIIVLIFALAQDLFWTGVGATMLMGLGTALMVTAVATLAVAGRRLAIRVASAPSGAGMLALRGIEVAAAAAIIAFGVLLLAGYMASEQLWMFTG